MYNQNTDYTRLNPMMDSHRTDFAFKFCSLVLFSHQEHTAEERVMHASSSQRHHTRPYRLLGVLLLLTYSLMGCSKSSTHTSSGALNTINADTLSFKQLKNDWLVINYWAAWCGPCRDEIPELNDLAAQHTDIRVIGVNYDTLTHEALARDTNALNIQFPVLIQDPSTRFQFDRPSVLPATYIFSPQLNLIKVLNGPQTKDTILSVIRSATPKDAK
ncbi:MAG: TlpA disulfide reductase family protein [Pseudomonadota bacterium]